jgi:acetyltransferase-like isoleucine patch superfamily enzyme
MPRFERITLANALRLTRYGMAKARYRSIRGARFNLERGADFKVFDGADFHVAPRVSFGRDFTGHFHAGSVTEIGDRVWFSRACTVHVHDGLRIGDNCIFGEQVSIHDANHVATGGTDPISLRGFHSRPVEIGRNVWIGAKATILPGAVIGDNAVIGSNSVVNSTIPAGAIAVGAPARVVGEVASASVAALAV